MSKGKIIKASISQLSMLGWLGMSISIIVAFCGAVFYDYGVFSSISASATTHSTTNMILPFILGAMALFAFAYRGYNRLDHILAKCMAIGFSIVALFPCTSTWNRMIPYTGFLGTTANTTDIIHVIGAALGFGAMWFWVMFCFTKSDKKNPHPQKLKRNKIYRYCAYSALFGFSMMLWGGYVLPNTFMLWAEHLILLPLSFAVLVKADTFRWLADEYLDKK